MTQITLVSNVKEIEISNPQLNDTLVYSGGIWYNRPLPAASGAGHTIQSEGVSLPQRTNLNFVGAGVTVTDIAGVTTVTISGVATSGGGDMLKSVYDSNNDGTVNSADSVPWTGVTGKPDTFPPAFHNHPVISGILYSGAAKPYEAYLNFVGEISVIDDPANSRITITVPSGIDGVYYSGVAQPYEPVIDFTGNLAVVDEPTKHKLTVTVPTTISWDNITGKPLFDVYFKDAVSTVSGYAKLVTIPTSGTENDDFVSVVVGDGEKLIEAYILDDVSPTKIDAGTWQFNFWSSVSSTAGTSQLVFRVYKRTSGGSETEFFNVASSAISSTSVVAMDILTSQADCVLGTDKLVVKVFAKTSSASSKTIHFYHDGTAHNSHFHTAGFATTTVGHIIQDEGVSLTTRSKLNFSGYGVSVTDDLANDANVVAVPYQSLFVLTDTFISNPQPGDLLQLDANGVYWENVTPASLADFDDEPDLYIVNEADPLNPSNSNVLTLSHLPTTSGLSTKIITLSGGRGPTLYAVFPKKTVEPFIVPAGDWSIRLETVVHCPTTTVALTIRPYVAYSTNDDLSSYTVIASGGELISIGDAVPVSGSLDTFITQTRDVVIPAGSRIFVAYPSDTYIWNNTTYLTIFLSDAAFPTTKKYQPAIEIPRIAAGLLSKSVYDTDDNGRVDSADLAINALTAGRAGTADYASFALDSDTVDGYHALSLPYISGIQLNDIVQTRESTLNFKGAGTVTITMADDSGSGRTNITISGQAVSSSGGHVIQLDTTVMPSRGILSFSGSYPTTVQITDSSANNTTAVTISGNFAWVVERSWFGI